MCLSLSRFFSLSSPERARLTYILYALSSSSYTHIARAVFFFLRFLCAVVAKVRLEAIPLMSWLTQKSRSNSTLKKSVRTRVLCSETFSHPQAAVVRSSFHPFSTHASLEEVL